MGGETHINKISRKSRDNPKNFLLCFAPGPNTRIPTKDFCLQPGLKSKFLLRITWLGQQFSHCNFQDVRSLSEENQVSLLRISFSHPESHVGHLLNGGPKWGVCFSL